MRRPRLLGGLALALAFAFAPVLPAAVAEGGRRVVLISLDGCRADAVTREIAPHVAALREAGVAARVARADLPPVTMTNHATMLTGLSILDHRVLIDSELPGTIGELTLFDYATAAGLRCAFFASKDKLRYFVHDGSVETFALGQPEEIVAQAVAALRPDGPDLIFIHFRDPDSTGHREGWMSDDYLAALGRMDAHVGRLVEAARADATRETYFLVTADHGGQGFQHILPMPEVVNIPWIVAGPGIAPNSTLDADVFTADTMPTALRLLGVAAPETISGVARVEPPPTASQPASLISIASALPCVLAAWGLLSAALASSLPSLRRA